MSVRYVGLDVHKHVIEACFLDQSGRVLKRHRFELTPPGLAQFARDHLAPDDHLALEATTNTWARRQWHSGTRRTPASPTLWEGRAQRGEADLRGDVLDVLS